MSNEFKVKNGLIVVGDTTISGAATVGGNSVIHTGNVGSYAVTSLSDTLHSVTGRGATTTNAIAVGGLTVGDSHFIGNESFYDNLLLLSSAGEGIVLGSNTNIFFNTGATANNSVGTSRMYVDGTTGNVGIGTSSPSKKLHIYTSDNEGIFLQGTGNGVWMDMQVNTANIHSIGAQIGGMGIYNRTVGAYRMFINDAGNVGIGTTNPTEKLTVDGNILLTDSLNQERLILFRRNSADVGKLTATALGIQLQALVNKRVAIVDDSNNGMFIVDGGNVGIGTTAPAYKLDVNGVTAANGLIISGGAAVEDAINITNGRLTLGGHNNGAGVWYEDIAGASEWFVGLSLDDVNYRFYNAPAATDRVVIYANGTVQFNTYGAGLLRTTANGLITVDTNTYLTGITAAQVHGAIYTTSGDANTYTTFGIYRNYDVNGPVAGHTTILNVMQADGNYGFQLGANTSSSADGLYFRSKDSTIGTWKQVASRQWVTAQGYATTSYVTTAIANLVDSAPATLDTLNELAAALGDDPNFATTVTNSIAAKLPLAGGTMTGIINTNSNISFSEDSTGVEFYSVNSLKKIAGRGMVLEVDPSRAASSYLEILQSSTYYFFWNSNQFSITDVSNWNTAYSWGNHALAGYATTTQLADYLPLTGGTIAGVLTVSGNLTVNGTITENSSIKIKENVEDLNGSLKKVVNLRPVSYNKIGQTKKELGLIAEEVQTVYPEFVQFDENGEPVGVNYSRLTVALIGAVQELTKQVEELKNKING